MAIRCKPYPVTTSTSLSSTVKTCVDVTNPSSSPYISDKDGNILYTWSVSKKNWEPLGSASDNMNPSLFGTETFGSFLTKNNDIFTKNTIKIVNDELKGSPASTQTFRNSNAFTPWNQWSSAQPNGPGDPQSGDNKPGDTLPGPNGSIPTSNPPPDNPTVGVADFKDIKTELKTEFTAIPDGEIISYPEKISTNQDVIKFSVYDVKTNDTGGRVSSNAGGENQLNLKFQFNPREFIKKGGDVILPIQSGIGDQNAVDWSGSPLNAIDAATYDLSERLMRSTGNQVGQTLYGAATQITEAAKGQQGRIQRYFAGLAANQNNILARTDNVILNPNLELLFNAPTLRPFNFTFKLSGRQKDESDRIKKIIRFFKANMAVRREVNNIFLRAPLVFKIQYLYRKNDPNETHPGLNLIKMCALTNMSVDYTPQGTYMTYAEDGSMVSYTINLQFQELTPIYQDDYENFSYGTPNETPIKNHPIGP